jgi:hypothetical protein
MQGLIALVPCISQYPRDRSIEAGSIQAGSKERHPGLGRAAARYPHQ